MKTASRRWVPALLVAASVTMAPTPAAASEGVGPPTCPPGFPSIMTIEDALARYAGHYSEEVIRAGFTRNDVNGNGFFCYRTGPFDRFYPLVIYFDDFEGLGDR